MPDRNRASGLVLCRSRFQTLSTETRSRSATPRCRRPGSCRLLRRRPPSARSGGRLGILGILLGGSGGELAINPRSSGFRRTGVRECRCHDGEVARYRSRISGPLLDRIDIYVDVPSIDVSELRAENSEETGATVRVCLRRSSAQTAGCRHPPYSLRRATDRAGFAIDGTVGERYLADNRVARTITCLTGRDEIDDVQTVNQRWSADHSRCIESTQDFSTTFALRRSGRCQAHRRAEQHRRYC